RIRDPQRRQGATGPRAVCGADGPVRGGNVRRPEFERRQRTHHSTSWGFSRGGQGNEPAARPGGSPLCQPSTERLSSSNRATFIEPQNSRYHTVVRFRATIPLTYRCSLYRVSPYGPAARNAGHAGTPDAARGLAAWIRYRQEHSQRVE